MSSFRGSAERNGVPTRLVWDTFVCVLPLKCPPLPCVRRICRSIGVPADLSAQRDHVCWRSSFFVLYFPLFGFGYQCAEHLRMGTTCTATDTTLVIRCPHCKVGTEFRPMIAFKDGRFVCRDCAHTVRPGIPEYKCTCRPCLRQEQKKPS